MSRRHPVHWSNPWIAQDYPYSRETTATGFRLDPIGGAEFSQPQERLPSMRAPHILGGRGRWPEDHAVNWGSEWYQDPRTGRWMQSW
jgi:hypothetical protein